MANELTTKDLAEDFGVSTKTLRRFLRSQVVASGGTVGEDTPGKGKRYSFEKTEVPKIRKDFKAWSKKQAEKKAESEAISEDSVDAETD